MRHELKTEQWVPYPVELVFAFFANPENLPPLMPRWQRARIEEAKFVAPPERPRDRLPLRSFAAGTGSIITISFRPFPFSPVRLPWEALIAEFAWNDHFCDEQVRGPFAYWRHCHHVSEEQREGQAGTLVRDLVTYEMKFGAAGELAHSLAMRRQMQGLFAFRQRRLVALLPRLAERFHIAPGASR